MHCFPGGQQVGLSGPARGYWIKMFTKSEKATRLMMLAALLAGSTIPSTVRAQSAQGRDKDAVPAATPAASTPYRNQPPRIANREAAIFEAVWGIEDPTVKAVESGVILRFSYRVIDPVKAKPLNDKKLAPVLESPEKRIQLVVPSMEKVGQLRQAPEKIEAGKSYWMAFSNSGRPLKPGDHVDVVIGNFRAHGLVVE
jgi:hypothetical protein